MLTVITKKTFYYTRQEIWFWKGEEIKHSNNDMFYVSFVKPDFKTNYFKEVTTLLIDLKQNQETLFEGIKPNFRNEIRRAEKIECVCNVIEEHSENDLKNFMNEYKKFAKGKGIDEELNMERLLAYSKSEVFITTTVSCSGQDIATHAYILHGNNSAALLYSLYNIGFTDDAIKGYANKYLHWQDILYFKTKGFSFYDFGGIDTIDTPEGIAKFKQSFGGNLVHGYNFSRVSGLYGFLSKFRL